MKIQPPRSRKGLLVFQDAVGITSGYTKIWASILHGAGFEGVPIYLRSCYAQHTKEFCLSYSKTRKQPGFSKIQANRIALATFVESCVAEHRPEAILCMDPALLFIVNNDWSQATLDKLRGGVYYVDGIPWVISLPITAWHNSMKAKDIAKLNDGFTEKSEWEESQDEDEDRELGEEDEESMEVRWQYPLVVPYGKFMLKFDTAKARRIIERIRNDPNQEA